MAAAGRATATAPCSGSGAVAGATSDPPDHGSGALSRSTGSTPLCDGPDGDATAPHDSVISVHVGEAIDEAYEEAQRRGYEIVHPLTEEAWGLRRFFVRAPDGNVINVVSHSDE